MGTASWIVRNIETGEVLFETFNRKLVAALNTAKYEAVPVLSYLANLNRGISDEAKAQLAAIDANQRLAATRGNSILVD